MTAVILFLLASGMVVFGTVSSGLNELKSASDLNRGKESYFLSEAGVEDMVYRLKNAVPVDTSEVLTLGDYTITTQKSAGAPGKVEVTGRADRAGYRRSVNTTLVEGSGAAFFYGVQVGEGGVTFNNSSTVNGNLYSDGPIVGTSYNLVKGDIISAGSSGSITGMHATGTLFARYLNNSIADKDAHYQIIDSYTSSHVAGVKYPNSPNQATTTLPISDAQITEWESEAAAGGTVTCSGGSYTITGSTTFGPKKIPCNLNVSNDGILTLTGAIWVTGNITFSNNADIKVSSTLSGKSVPIIADKTTNRSSSSQIFISNSTQFIGADGDSYVLLISQNNSAELGGGNMAIIASNSINGDVLLYAGHGRVEISNSASVKEITAYKLQFNNSAEVIYRTGLTSLIFSAGPSGGYTIDSWQEVE